MTIAELIVKVVMKIDGLDKLVKINQALQQAAQAAKGAGQQAGQAAAAVGNVGTQAGAAAGQVQKVPPVLNQTAQAAGKASQGMGGVAKNTAGAAMGMKALEHWAARTAIKLDAVTAAMLYLVDTAMKGAAQLENFKLGTGLSAGALQREQAKGVRVGISPDEMARFVKSLQTAGANLQIGGEGASDWALFSSILGIKFDPRMNPFKLIDMLHDRLSKLTPQQVALVRVVAGRVGIGDNIFSALRNPRFNLKGFEQMYDLVAKNEGKMADLNAEWALLQYNVGATKNGFISVFASFLEGIVEKLTQGAAVFAKFTEWLDQGSTGAKALKGYLEFLAIAVGTLAAAFTLLVPILWGISIATGVIGAEFIPIIAVVGLLAAGIWAIDKAAQALGERFRWLVDSGLLAAIGTVIPAPLVSAGEYVYRKAKGSISNSDGPSSVAMALGEFGGAIAGNLPIGDYGAMFRQPNGSGAAGTTLTQTNSFTVNEAMSPGGIVKTVADVNRQMLNTAGYSVPAPMR